MVLGVSEGFRVSVVCGCSVVLWFPVGFGVFRVFMFLLSALSWLLAFLGVLGSRFCLFVSGFGAYRVRIGPMELRVFRLRIYGAGIRVSFMLTKPETLTLIDASRSF